MHGTPARSNIFGRQRPAKEAKWVHNGGKRALTMAARAQKMRFVMQCARSRFAKIMLPAEGGKHFLIKSCEIIPSRRRAAMTWTDFHILYSFFSRHDRDDAYMCKLGGTEKSQGRPLALQTHGRATFFKAPLGDHKAKEKGTKEQRSDTSKKK